MPCGEGTKFKDTEIGLIPESWEIKSVNSFCSKITSGGTPSRSNPEYWINGTIPWLKTQELNDGNIYDSEERITQKGLENSSAKLFAGNTVLMAMYGATVGKLGILRNEATTNQAFCAMIVDNTIADYRFLFYSLLSRRDKLINLASGAAQQNLNQDIIKDFLLPFPSLPEQNAIAKCLSDLDAKVELNQQMNKTLEAVGAAVFRRWFVDFEFPDGEGKPYRSSGGEMVHNEKLGKEVPKDWKVVEITEVALIVDCLHSKKPRRTETGPVLLQVFNIDKTGYLDLSDPFNVSAEVYKFWTRNIEVKGGDCVITNAGRVGAIAQIPEESQFGIGRNMTAIRPNKISPTYLINYLLSKYGFDEIQKNVDTGTILDSLNVKGIIKIKILMPPQTILDQYENFARPLRKRIEINNNQAFTLSGLRDRLLPRLMSGKIRVPVVKEMEM